MSQRQRIIDEATEMFISEGLRSVRMDDISKKLGISKRTLYEIFRDKESLIMDCVMHNHKITLERTKKSVQSAENILEEIMLMINMWDKNIENQQKLMMNLMKFYPEIHNRIAAKEQEENIPMFREKLEEGTRQGLIMEGLDLELAIRMLIGSIYGLMAQKNVTLPKEYTHMDIIRQMFMFFIRSISTEKGIKIVDKYIKIGV